jgi:16S rRNA (guanine1207-N2)-methyltransferase
VVFWLVQPERGNGEAAAALSRSSACRADGFETAPGGFSHNGVDPGSQFLLASLPDDLSGAVADFGAGWGYLAAGIAGTLGRVSAIDLYEAHYPSLEAARRNLARGAAGVPCEFFWHDLLSEPVTRRYDIVVMNPPFHRGRAAEPAIGSAMIRSAARALKTGGRLFMVANRPLPYEPVLASAFAAHGEIVRNARFKVLWARRQEQSPSGGAVSRRARPIRAARQSS